MSLTAMQYESAFCGALKDMGFCEAFAAERAAALAPFFRALADADDPALFSGPAREDARGAFLTAAFPPAEASAASACRAAFVVLDRALLAGIGAKPRKKRTQARPRKATASLPLPSAADVAAFLTRLRESEAFAAREEERRRLFAPDAPLDAAQLRFAARECGARIPDPDRTLLLLKSFDPAAAAATGTVREMERLIPCFSSSRSAMPLAVSLCRCYNPAAYPAAGVYPAAVLRYFRDERGFYPFRDEETENYTAYKRVLTLFRMKYALVGFSLCDTALWLSETGKILLTAKEKES